MLKSNSNKITKDTITRSDKKEAHKSYKVNYTRTKQNSKILNKERTTTKQLTIKKHNEPLEIIFLNNNNTNLNTPKANKSIRNEGVGLSNINLNNTFTNLHTGPIGLTTNTTKKSKPSNTKSSSFIKKINSKKSLKDEEKSSINLLTFTGVINKEESPVINTMPNTKPISTKNNNEYERKVSYTYLKEKTLNEVKTKAPSLEKKPKKILDKSNSNNKIKFTNHTINTINTNNTNNTINTSNKSNTTSKKNLLKKIPNNTNRSNNTKNNKLFKHTERIIKELEESKIKENNNLDTIENLEIRKVNFTNFDDEEYEDHKVLNTVNTMNHIDTAETGKCTTLFNTLNNRSNTNYKSLSPLFHKTKTKASAMSNTITIKKLSSIRPKSEYKEKENTNILSNKRFSAKSNKTSIKPKINIFTKHKDLNEIKEKEEKENNKTRAKSSYKKPEIELKLNEGSLSTEASSIYRGRLEDYAIGKEIGKGAYAIVKQGLHKPSNRKVAIKIYDKVKLLDTQRKNSVKREISILKKLDHNNIVKLHEVIDNPKQILLVMELVNGVSLLTYLKSKPDRRIEETECKDIFFQIVRALSHCHIKNICHRDIKLENIIVDEMRTIKIIDFGFGTVTAHNKLLNFFCGTPSYMPPEIVQKRDYNGQEADVWSLGILLYTLLCGAFPFRALNEKDLYSKITKGVYNFPDHMTSCACELVRRMLNLTPSNRPVADTVLSDIWFNNSSYTKQYITTVGKLGKLDKLDKLGKYEKLTTHNITFDNGLSHSMIMTSTSKL